MERKKKYTLPIIIVSLVIFMIILIAIPKSNLKKEIVKCKKVIKTDFEGYIFTNGNLNYKYVEKIGGEYDGRIIKTYVSTGSKFKKGDLLFEIGYSKYLLDLYSDFMKVERTLEFTEKEYLSSEKVFEKGGISRQNFENIKNNYIDAKDHFINHRFWKYKDFGYTYANGRFLIKSPFSGQVIKLNYQDGERLEPEKPIAVITKGKEMTGVLNVNILDSQKIKIRDTVKITSDVLPDLKINGIVNSIDLEPKRIGEAQVIEVGVAVNINKNLPNRIPIDGKIIYEIKHNIIKVPIESLFERDSYFHKRSKKIKKKVQEKNRSLYYVYVVTPQLGKKDIGILKKQVIKIKMQNDFFVEVIDGLEEGDIVVYFSEQSIFVGEEVKYELN